MSWRLKNHPPLSRFGSAQTESCLCRSPCWLPCLYQWSYQFSRAQNAKSHIFLLWNLLDSVSVAHAPQDFVFMVSAQRLCLFLTSTKKETEAHSDPEGCCGRSWLLSPTVVRRGWKLALSCASRKYHWLSECWRSWRCRLIFSGMIFASCSLCCRLA